MKLSSLFGKKKKSDLSQLRKNVRSLSTELATRENSISAYGLSALLPNPDPILKKLGKDVEIYKELLSDPHLYGCIQSRKAGVLSLEWDIIEQGTADTEAAELIKKIFAQFDMEEFIRQILNAPLFGFQPLEIIWNYDGNYFYPERIEARPVEWFTFDSDNQLRFRKGNSWNGVKPDKDKFLLPTHEASYDNPYGTALLSKCYWNVVFRKNGKKFWITFTEKFGMPWLLGKYLAGTESKKADEIMEALVGMFRDGIIVYPDSLEIDIRNPGQSASADIYEKLIQDCRMENSVLILGHTGASLSTPGKLGNEEMAIKAAQRVIDSDKRLVEKTLNQLIKMICKYNFNTDSIPVFKFYEADNIKTKLAERDKILIDCGVKFNKDYYKNSYNLQEGYFDIE